ncbi:hypothetical protein CVT24_002305 [Panaeolus cyanescens]|uniref:Uncharacterized protein n=1 Tax=Panaeolus cyanescens TaxID=181874 RepID=A0A409YIM1_9AGAR|nr:hypothetical protein CVT24_002305 [Panaeolus cyanescens]
MPGLTISRTKTSFLNWIKAAISWTKVVNKSSANDDAPLKPLEKAHPTKPRTTINDLPPEILTIIFHAYMFWEDEPDLVDPELEGVVPVFSPNPCAAPLLFCGVSSYWRNVAISSPALWSAIAIRDKCRPEAIALWLERSQTQPLSLLVSLGQNVADTDKFARLLKMLYANMSRWKHVSFQLPTSKDMRQLMFNLMPQGEKSPAPQLKLLELPSEANTTGRHYWWSSTPQVFSFPQSTLRHLSWGCHVAPNFSRIPEKSLWLNLQQITFSTISTHELISFLRVCENLQVINIKVLHTMPGLTTSRTGVPFLNKIKDALSRTNVVKELNVVTIPASGVPPNANCAGASENQQHESPHPLPDSSINGSRSCQSNPRPVSLGSPTALGIPSRPSLAINDLPPEILATIFHTYMFWEDESDLIDPELEGMVSVFLPNAHSAPLLFCNVCSYWRNIAISIPALWSSFVIQDNCYTETIALWLQRSQTHPLSLLVSLGNNLANTDKLARLMEMLYANMPRWKRVSFHLPTAKDMRNMIFNLIPERGKSPATQLQHLHFCPAYRHNDHRDFHSLSRLSSFPHSTLQRFSWSDFVVLDFSRIPTTLWSNLRQITFSMITERVLLSFLKACKNLQFINIDFLHETVDAGLPTTPRVVAHNLQALNVGMVVGNLGHTINFLTTPNLKRLSFSHRGGSGIAISLQDFLERSRCTLECLCMICKNPEFDEAETMTMLHSSTFTTIPHFSLRLITGACRESFPRAIIVETSGQWKDVAYAYHDPKNDSYHLGWGLLDIAHTYQLDYPFLIKKPKPTVRWFVGTTPGPLTSA